MGDYSSALFPQHVELLRSSAVAPEVADARGYRSVDTKAMLERAGFSRIQRSVPGLLVPVHGVDGTVRLFQYRPDTPRVTEAGKPVKYETPTKSRMVLDVPPAALDALVDPTVPLWVTEGSRKADAAVTVGLCCVGLLGVWNWRGSNGAGGKAALPDWDSVALNRDVVICFDSDVMIKDSVAQAVDRFSRWLESRSAKVRLVYLPEGEGGAKVGLDDYLAAGHTAADLMSLVGKKPPRSKAGPAPDADLPPVEPHTLGEAESVFRRWLHVEDAAPMLAVAATVVANRTEGDPVWLLIVGPPSSGKTETLQACARLPEIVPAATISEAALLSGTQKRDRAPDATGGLLRQVGEYGIILAKDFTSVLSQNKDTAKQATAALREIADGSWDRPTGSDGGRVLHWSGKCGLIGGVTPSYDRYAQIVSALGDRFLLIRLPNVDAATQATSALDNSEREKTMRAELSAAMTGLIAGADRSKVYAVLSESDRAELVRLASFAAYARTAVERDGYSKELVVLPQPEGPARLVKAMRRLYGGLGAVGVDDRRRWQILRRVAIDCAPAIRRPLMEALLEAAGPARTSNLAAAVGMVTKTAHNHLDDLALIGIAVRTKAGGADNSPDLWAATPWLVEHWPMAEVGTKTTTKPTDTLKCDDTLTPEDAENASPCGHPRSSRSHSDDAEDDPASASAAPAWDFT